MRYKLGIDVGGTFTDFLLVDESGKIKIEKIPSTPARPADAVLQGLESLARKEGMILDDFMAQIDIIVHGTTITTNAVLTAAYAKTGLLTTKGFRDLLNERRGIKRNAFTSKEAPPDPIVPRYLIIGAEERVDCEGNAFIPLNEQDVYEAAEFFKEQGVKAVAVNFLFSFLNPSHEKRAAEILGNELPDTYICTSSEVLPQPRVYERGSTVVFNACTGPALRSYIQDLVSDFERKGFKGVLRIMQSNGGVMSPEIAMDFAVNTLLSGPASGPVAGIHYAESYGIKDIVTADMGGTSFDCCLILDKEPEVTTENEIAGYAMAMPSLAIHTFGAGGGSIAYVDDAGLLQVGPRSAGAMPGPACYGLGGKEPTVTDADVLLGYINPDYFLGGTRKLNLEFAQHAVEEKIAKKLGISLQEAAYGIYQVVNSNMANGIRVASISRGADPRRCAFIVAGGAGPVHACAIADDLDMQLILIPKSSSVFCASGMLISNLRHDFIRASYMLMEEGNMNIDAINVHLKEMTKQGNDLLEKEMIPPEKRKFTYSCDLRYEGQFNEIETPLPLSSDGKFTTDQLPLLQKFFDQRHTALYGYSLPGSTMELISLRVSAEGITKKPSFKEVPFVGEDAFDALKGEREIYYNGSRIRAQVYDGLRINGGNRISGPAVVEEPTTTVVVAPNYELVYTVKNDYVLYHKGKNLQDIIVGLTE